MRALLLGLRPDAKRQGLARAEPRQAEATERPRPHAVPEHDEEPATASNGTSRTANGISGDAQRTARSRPPIVIDADDDLDIPSFLKR